SVAITSCPSSRRPIIRACPSRPALPHRTQIARRPPFNPRRPAMPLDNPDDAVLEPHRAPLDEPQMTEAAFKSEFLQTMQARGFIHQITHPAELDEACLNGPI